MTVTSTIPAVPAGAVAVIEVAVGVPVMVPVMLPKLTAVAPVNAVPVMVTDVPPVTEPEVGEMLDTVGAAASYVYWSPVPVADVPRSVVTVTSTTPAAWAGAITVIKDPVFAVMVAGVLPKSTTVAPVKPVP